MKFGGYSGTSAIVYGAWREAADTKRKQRELGDCSIDDGSCCAETDVRTRGLE
jgi:hypothetical protein